jgi:hypothetical protein
MGLRSAGGSSNQPDFVQISGPVPWFSIALLITADGLDPDEVVRLLGVEPDLDQSAAARADIGMGRWESHGMLIDRIPASAANRGLELSTDLMRRLVDMGLRLGLDICADEEVAYIRPVQPIG